MRDLGIPLANVERLFHCEMVNGVRAAEIEAEQVHREQPPRIQHLALLHDVFRFDITIIVHIGANEMQAKSAQKGRQHVNHGEDI